MFAKWLESMGQNPRTFFKDAVVFVIRSYVIIFVVLLPIPILTFILKPFTSTIHAAMPKVLTPATPQFWLILVPFGIYMLFAVATAIALIGGWYQLARKFPAPQKFKDGQLFKFQSGSVGASNYARVLTIRVAPQGLYLACILPFRLMHPPILIPWSQIKAARQKRLFRRVASYLTVGSPKIATIALENPKIVEAAKQWLPQN